MFQPMKVILLHFLLGVSQIVGAQQPKNEAISVSIVNLLATPEKFHGKMIKVIGFVHIEFECSAVFLHADDFKFKIFKNALEIGVPVWASKSPKKYNNRYALIEGIFDSANTGHMGLFAGSIREITRISPIPIPAA